MALFESAADVHTIVDPKEAAACAGLRHVSDARPGIRRRKLGKGFTYTRPDGSRVTEADVLRRIKSLAIPPAWTDVWICPSAGGHIQATGRDAKGRKQYRYHGRFREVRESTKYEHVVEFAEALPAIRPKVRDHMTLRGLPREKVLATVVHLLETTLIRVGNDDYARQNNSYGLTTLKTRHVAVNGNAVRFRFTGKSGKQWSLRVRDRRIAKIIRACQDLPGQELLQYLDDEGKSQDVTSSDVNAYLKEITGKNITAKDFVRCAFDLRTVINRRSSILPDLRWLRSHRSASRCTWRSLHGREEGPFLRTYTKHVSIFAVGEASGSADTRKALAAANVTVLDKPRQIKVTPAGRV